MSAFTVLYQHPRFRAAALPVLLLVMWSMATRHEWVSSLVLVPFEQLAETLLDPAVRASLWDGLRASFVRLAQGVAIGLLVGLLLGAGMGSSRVFDRIMGPSFHALRQVAILAWVPLLTAWFGNGDACKIAFIAIAASKPMVMGAYEGVRAAPDNLREVATLLKLPRLKVIRCLVLPAAAPAIITAVQLSLIYSWFAAIGAEYVIGVMSGGIGSVVMAAQEHFRTDIVLLGVMLIALVGICMNKLLKKIAARLCPWQQR